MPAAQDAIERSLAIPDGLDSDQALRARLLAGTAARIQGKTGDAVKFLEAYASSAPVSAASKDDLFGTALWLQRRGRFDSALAALEKLRRVLRDAEIGFQYGYTLELAGREEDALKAYLQVTYGSTNAQWALTARYRAAELMVTLGRKDDAIALYRELVARSEGTVQGKFAKRRLDELTSQPAPTAIPPAPGEEEKTDETPAPAH
jgi:tetratricopeptide (TPR) repeat protein